MSKPLNSFDHGGVAGVLLKPVCAFTAADLSLAVTRILKYYRAISIIVNLGLGLVPVFYGLLVKCCAMSLFEPLNRA